MITTNPRVGRQLGARGLDSERPWTSGHLPFDAATPRRSFERLVGRPIATDPLVERADAGGVGELVAQPGRSSAPGRLWMRTARTHRRGPPGGGRHRRIVIGGGPASRLAADAPVVSRLHASRSRGSS
jgi:hypothetical protein